MTKGLPMPWRYVVLAPSYLSAIATGGLLPLAVAIGLPAMWLTGSFGSSSALHVALGILWAYFGPIGLMLMAWHTRAIGDDMPGRPTDRR